MLFELLRTGSTQKGDGMKASHEMTGNADIVTLRTP